MARRCLRRLAEMRCAFGSSATKATGGAGLIGLLILMAAARPWSLAGLGPEMGGALLAAFAAACIAGAGFFLLDRILGLLGPIGKIRGLDELQRLSRGATRVVPSKLMFAKVVGSSVVGAALAPLIVYILGLGAWAGVSLWDCFAVVPAVGLTMMLPISFGGWGVREGVMVALLSALGVVPEKALALSPAQGLILLFASLPGGLLWLSYRRDRGLAGRPHAEDLVPTKPSHRQL